MSNHCTMASLASIQFKQMNFNTLSTTVHVNFELWILPLKVVTLRIFFSEWFKTNDLHTYITYVESNTRHDRSSLFKALNLYGLFNLIALPWHFCRRIQPLQNVNKIFQQPMLLFEWSAFCVYNFVFVLLLFFFCFFSMNETILWRKAMSYTKPGLILVEK